MHLLAAKPGGFVDDEGIIDLAQTPAEVVILSSQDTSLGLLADVADQLTLGSPSIRLANLAHLSKPAAYDLYEEKVLRHARIVLVSLLGGKSYWAYGVEKITELCHRENILLIMVAGDDQADAELSGLSNLPENCPENITYDIWRYLREGGMHNAENLFKRLFQLIDPKLSAQNIAPPKAFPHTLLYAPGGNQLALQSWQSRKQPDLPTVLLLFYRSHVQSGNTAAFDVIIETLEKRANVLAVAIVSMRNSRCIETVNLLMDASRCDVVINTTSFSQHTEGNPALSSQPQMPAREFLRNVPVIQAILSASSEEDWRNSNQGLRARDIAMNVALPEFDGRIISRAITFKESLQRSEIVEMDVIRYRALPERVEFVAALALAWAKLGRTKNQQKHIALILSNYPTKDGRIGNGVGLDTPASVINILHKLKQHQFDLGKMAIPENGDQLIRILQQGVTNNLDLLPIKQVNIFISENSYLRHFHTLPESNQQAINQRWGDFSADPNFIENGFANNGFALAGILLGKIFIGIQPARGFNVDLAANYHDPDLLPPHGYLAFYYYLRHEFHADAIAHIGKHGNLEWLPGKSVGLSENCWSDAILGALPHLYPFIVNDPGEGAQAKRRTQAVILDHLMPPMARAETYGELAELENLVDEYYQAMGLDSSREKFLVEQIIALTKKTQLLSELKITAPLAQKTVANDAAAVADDLADATNQQQLLDSIDTYLCDLKEAQIRHGLHRFGQPPAAEKMSETCAALTRIPRGQGALDQSLLHAICQDFKLENATHETGTHEIGEHEINGRKIFDPLNFDPAGKWQGGKPDELLDISPQPWRTEADTRERLELLAQHYIEQHALGNTSGNAPEGLPATCQLLDFIKNIVAPAVIQSGINELENFISALEGKQIPAGPSGAPTRGRLDVLPTGRNFYSLDSRSIPTQSAWILGQKSADKLLMRHLQEHGDYPKQLGISVWGTATMRTGGDDIAQAMALMGVRPIWAQGSNRVIDIEIISGVQLERPRVDVTLRISGFFRDAFPNIIRLFDCAVQALADYQDPGGINVIRENINVELSKLIERGIDPQQAKAQSRYRIFGSKPGAYGAGLQGLIDERIWNNSSDLARAYVNWGGYAYGQNAAGKPAFQAFESRLGQLDGVIQNQDNREHDLLDSDDYYQFQGGMANAAEVLSGVQPAIYHGDHSNPASPIIRTLKEELNRVIRSRVVNPKWIESMQQHGYKGAFEMAATVDYLFAYDATTGLIEGYQYAMVTDALILDANNREFMQAANPHALKEAATRLLEAQQRGLWADPGEYEEKLIQTIVDIDNSLEMGGEV